MVKCVWGEGCYTPRSCEGNGVCLGYEGSEKRTIQVIDSAKAVKALDCVEKIAEIVGEYHTAEDLSQEHCYEIGELLQEYGFAK